MAIYACGLPDTSRKWLENARTELDLGIGSAFEAMAQRPNISFKADGFAAA